MRLIDADEVRGVLRDNGFLDDGLVISALDAAPTVDVPQRPGHRAQGGSVMDAPDELRRCPDDGRCWHDCAPTDCFRVVGGCVPLSDYGTDWKPEDIARFGCVMDAPDELRQAVIESIRQADYECEMAESVQMPFASWTEHQADAVLAVPAIADALRAAERDAKVAAAVKWRQEQDDDDDTADMVAMAMVISTHMAAP